MDDPQILAAIVLAEANQDATPTKRKMGIFDKIVCAFYALLFLFVILIFWKCGE